MKNMKKILALVVAVLMIVASVSAMAATITIQDNGNVKVADHTFSAYQIFSGTLTGEGENKVLSDIVWGAGVNGANLLTALKADTEIGSKFTDCTTAEDVAKALKNASAADMVAFSRVVAENLGTAAATDVKGGRIEGLADGYYFVKDTTTIGEGDAASAFIVQLIGDKTITIKTDAPTITKEVKNRDEAIAAYREANNAWIGDTVDYRITSKVPDMSNYKKYYFVVNDTMSKGLTFNADSLAIKVGTKDLVKDTDYTVTATTSENGTAIEIVFKNFIQYQESQPGKDITITYNATINNAAEIGKSGNTNEVELVYSNNPNKDGKGEDKPGPDDDDVVGKTPKDTVITFTTNLKILKVDENEQPLNGVTFTIKGIAENNKVTYTEEFVKAENDEGEYWKLNTNPATYTKDAPTTLTAGKYASQTDKYNLVVKADTQTVPVTFAAKQGTTANGGILDIGALIANGSLPAGTYVIHEDSTLEGYNKLDHDIIVTVTNEITTDVKDIDFTNPDKNTKITWKVTGEGATVEDDGTIKIRIVNKSGSTLPSTGGIGTTLFYIGGGILVLAAVILLVTKRRMSAND